MEVKLQKWGNSDGIRIPGSFLKSLNLKTNDVVELIQKDDMIIIKPKKNHFTLAERIEMYNALPEEEKGSMEEYDWGESVGKEKID
jgi:antitoxin MazE